MKFIEDGHFNNKKVVVRCDFNVPISDGMISDDSKIVRSLKTIKYLLNQNAQVILLSHFGRIKSEEDKQNNSLMPVRYRLQELLEIPVTFVSNYPDSPIDTDSKVVLLENTRFFDYPDNKESGNDPELAKLFAKLGDAFVFDAFGSAHRRHASTSGIAKYLPTYIGYLVKEEIDNLSKVLNHESPFTVIMGGAKVDDKLPIIKKLLPLCDYLLLGGGLANSFLKAMGSNIGKSLATDDENILVDLKCLVELYKDKIMVPLDVKTLLNEQVYTKDINDITDDEIIYDIGPKTISKYSSYIKDSNTIFNNGTMGLCEDERFADGTSKIFGYMAKVPTVVIGGGDTVSAIHNLGFGESFILSSGGGASLEYIANGSLPVLDDIE